MSLSYDQVFAQSLNDPEGFWAEAAEAVHWDRRWDRVLDDSNPPFYHWFQGAMCNTCYNALDRHVEGGRGDQLALIWDSPFTQAVQRFTYSELLDEVSRFARVLAEQGLGKGDRAILYLPMTPQAVIAMLACARLGAVHSVVFGGFAANELAARIDDAQPKVLVTASCGLLPGKVLPYKPLVDQAIALATHAVPKVVLYQRPEQHADMMQGRDVDWEAAVASATPHPCVSVAATDPLYILYTSGTTGQPKGIVRDNGGHMVALLWSMKNVYGVDPGEVFWAASDVGWVVGHSYIVYGPLLNGNTTVLYEGKPVGTPDPGAFWRVIAEHGVCVLFTAPTAFRAIKREDPKGKFLHQHDLSNLRTLFLAGERADPATLTWAEQHLGVPVIDHWWQTESGWPMAANCMGLGPFKVKHGSPTKPVPGWDVMALDSDGQPVAPGDIGAIVVKLPMPPGSLPTLWNGDRRFIEAYMTSYPGFYETGDAGFVDEEGYLFVMTRTDDVINVAGHRLSTGQIEEVLSEHPDVAECAVIGVQDSFKGELPLGLLVLNAGAGRAPHDVVSEAVASVRARIGPVAAFRLAVVVAHLPKTRSGKILRGTMKHIADGTPWKLPATIEDPDVLHDIGAALATLGYPAG